jgi:hypothetical protein
VDAQGNLFGTVEQETSGLPGGVFEIAKGTNTITTLASFNGTNGFYPEGGVTLGADGELYGTTYYGGSGRAGDVGATLGDGTVFQLSVPEPSSLVMGLMSLALTSGAIMLKRRR